MTCNSAWSYDEFVHVVPFRFLWRVLECRIVVWVTRIWNPSAWPMHTWLVAWEVIQHSLLFVCLGHSWMQQHSDKTSVNTLFRWLMCFLTRSSRGLAFNVFACALVSAIDVCHIVLELPSYRAEEVACKSFGIKMQVHLWLMLSLPNLPPKTEIDSANYSHSRLLSVSISGMAASVLYSPKRYFFQSDYYCSAEFLTLIWLIFFSTGNDTIQHATIKKLSQYC